MFYKKPQNLTLLSVIAENKTRVSEKFTEFFRLLKYHYEIFTGFSVSFQSYYTLIAQIVMGVSEKGSIYSSLNKSKP